jgi:hypothetical protein
MSTIREFAKKDLISAVSGFYEADDIRILRDALLKKRELHKYGFFSRTP